MEQDKESRAHRYGPLLGGIAVLAVFGLVAYLVLGGMHGAKAPEPPKVQEISLVQPPPPPPPPPKMEEPPPPEQVIEAPKPEPEPVADDAPADEALPGDELGLDADGTAGSDGFGLRGKKGARGLIGGGDRNRWYAGVLQRELQSLLSGNAEVRGEKYAVVVKLWMADDGRVARFELLDSTGDDDSDAALRRTLAALHMKDTPPADMPQPVKLRIVAR
ncbi:MAG: TonB C-terminal domain-containing protein [Gammaproteobacteria bacterium]|jgi:protein TonB|nr:TonB C-terminal domain-containing protein [Gammaproteobacteria bacterium]